MQYINISSTDNNPVIYFNTGLDPRSFARTKMSQNLSEIGYIVNPDGSHEIWKPSRIDEKDGYMQFWGQLFNGQRLDRIIDEICPAQLKQSQNNKSGNSVESPDMPTNRQIALQAIVQWIRAKMFLGDTPSVRSPGAAVISCEDTASNSRVFFAPEYIANRCLLLENSEHAASALAVQDRFNSPDLSGLDDAAFCAAVMLYAVLTKNHPYPGDNNSQDMRDGFFLPISLAEPGLNEELSGLIQSALMLPVQNKKDKMSASDILIGILKILTEKDNNIRAISSLFSEITAEKLLKTDAEKKKFTLKQNTSIKIKRFVSRNRTAITISSACIIFALIITFSMIDSYAKKPTTAGMYPKDIIYAYLDAYSNLNFEFMEACVQGAMKNDINAAVNLTAIVRTRMAYESTITSTVTAAAWKENGGELPAPDVFGVTDLSVAHISGSEESGLIIYRADYLLWPFQEEFPLIRSDVMTLKPDKKNNWRITEIIRTEKQ